MVYIHFSTHKTEKKAKEVAASLQKNGHPAKVKEVKKPCIVGQFTIRAQTRWMVMVDWGKKK
jgi:hypothetical protein